MATSTVSKSTATAALASSKIGAPSTAPVLSVQSPTGIPVVVAHTHPFGAQPCIQIGPPGSPVVLSQQNMADLLPSLQAFVTGGQLT